MMALPGMTRDEFERIRPYVAALPAGTAINLCTAKAPVLAALAEGGADFGNEELLAANRKDGCYPDQGVPAEHDRRHAGPATHRLGGSFRKYRTGSAP